MVSRACPAAAGAAFFTAGLRERAAAAGLAAAFGAFAFALRLAMMNLHLYAAVQHIEKLTRISSDFCAVQQNCFSAL
jgi:hypothetical protein